MAAHFTTGQHIKVLVIRNNCIFQQLNCSRKKKHTTKYWNMVSTVGKTMLDWLSVQSVGLGQPNPTDWNESQAKATHVNVSFDSLQRQGSVSAPTQLRFYVSIIRKTHRHIITIICLWENKTCQYPTLLWRFFEGNIIRHPLGKSCTPFFHHLAIFL